VRLGEVELVEEAGTRSLAVRVTRGGRVATVSTSDVTPTGVERVVSDAIELCELSQADPAAGLPDPAELAHGPHADLKLYDPACGAVAAGEAVERCKRAERAAMDFDPRIKNTEGATFGRSTGAFALATSGGFRGGYQGSYASISVSPVVNDEGGKNRTAGYWSGNRVLAKLEGEVAVGREAGRRTIGLLGARKVPTGNIPVVFDPDAARAMLGAFAGCIVGDAVYRRSSYLCERLGSVVASPLVTLVDDPLIESGPGSRPFDADGLASRRNVVVDKGRLETFLLDTYSARKLGMKSTASAGSTTGTGAAVSNFVLTPGTMTRDEIIRTTPRGLYVTHMMGYGFNAVTGDFSRGASGYWIEDGAIAFPVSEVTISLNFDEIFKRIDAVGNDLDFRSSVASPTFRVSEMTLAGT
jgi:PmbA protein